MAVSTKRRAEKTVSTGTVISNVHIDMGTPDQEEAIIAAVQTALNILYKINLTPKYGIYVEASDGKASH